MALIVNHYNPEIRVCFDVDKTLVRWEDGKLIPHNRHIEELKNHWERGHHVTVWSAGGAKWAEHVVMHLCLGKYVHEEIAKPSWVYDDLEPNKCLERIYHAEEGFNVESYGAYSEPSRTSEDNSDVYTLTSGGYSSLHTVSEIEDKFPNFGEIPDESRSGAW